MIKNKFGQIFGIDIIYSYFIIFDIVIIKMKFYIYMF